MPGSNIYGRLASNSMKQIPTSRITDLTLGHLSPEESLKVLEEIEKSEELSAEFELVVDLINFFQHHRAETPPDIPSPLC